MNRQHLEHGLTDRSALPNAVRHSVAPPSRFSPEQRRVLLLQSGLGAGVLHRLEAAGFASFEALLARGVKLALEDAWGPGASTAVRNRIRAIERAIAAWQRLHADRT